MGVTFVEVSDINVIVRQSRSLNPKDIVQEVLGKSEMEDGQRLRLKCINL